MKKSLADLPEKKKIELERLKGIILEKVPDTQMIILFGSHARGDWVEERYMRDEEGMGYEYVSDFDVLVVTGKRSTAENRSIWDDVENKYLRSFNRYATPPSLITHNISYLNDKIDKGWYFFTDIKKEGILLYDSGNHKLARIRKLNREEYLERAKEDFTVWFGNAKDFYMQYENAYRKRKYRNAAFQLHQATEHAYHAILLTFTGYKPKCHNLKKLGKWASAHEFELKKVFLQKTEEERRLFELLVEAYIGARYKRSYSITKSELEYLGKCVKKLHSLTKKICKTKLSNLQGKRSPLGV
ncbi:MAG: hypothetical protein A2X49_07380 [Lentisphaerae bacterium GWF2_52_8]|nr:MAG: hypothetical protein A2X49_07380 [Lentisphaerae bacterium GWF2_52_8]